MKKIFSLLAIATIVATTFTSCKDSGSDEPTTPKKAKLSISVEKPTLKAGDKGKFTVKSDIAALEAIVIAVTSEDTKIITVEPASVTIAKDGKTIEGTYTAVADGKTKITITTTNENASIATGSVEVTVGTPAPVGADIVKMFTGKGDDDGTTYGYAYHEDPTDPAPEGSRANLAYFTFSDLDGTGLVMYVGGAKDKDMPMAMGEIKSQGDGKGIFLAPQAEGTAITFNTMVTSPSSFFLTMHTPDHTVFATGSDVYVVLACGDADNTTTTYRAWAKINLGAGGNVSALNIIEAYVCLNDGEFKVGQTK